MNDYDMVHYMVPIAGEGHHLELLPNTGMTGSSMVVETYGPEEKSPVLKKSKDTQCYFRGQVKGQKDSKVAVSTCHGLVSTLI